MDGDKMGRSGFQPALAGCRCFEDLTNFPEPLIYEYLPRKFFTKLKNSRIIIFIILITILSISTNSLHAADAPNLLQNPGFEDGTNGWQWYGGILTYIDNPVHGGSRAAVLIASEAEAYISQTVHVSPGSCCTFSGWAFKNSIYEGNISLRISWYESEDGTGSEIKRNESDSFADNPIDYRFLTTGTHTTPANAHSAKVKGIVRLANPGQFVTAYFDDMSFIETIPISNPTCAPN